MIHFEGDRSFALPVAEVAAKLSDVGYLASSLPDVQLTESKPERAAWKLRPKLAFLSGSLDTTMERTEAEPGKSITYKIYTKAVGATSTVITKLEFKSTDTGGTAIHWTGDLTQVTGLLKMVPKGLLQGTASKVIEDVWVAVTKKLESK